MARAHEAGSALLTDLYQITMLQSCFQEGLHACASFELSSRKLADDRTGRLDAQPH